VSSFSSAASARAPQEEGEAAAIGLISCRAAGFGALHSKTNLAVARGGVVEDFVGGCVPDERFLVTPLRELVEAAQQNEPVRIEGHDARRDWLYVDEAAEAARRFYSSNMGSRALNLSSGDPRPFWEVVEAVQSLFSLKVNDAANRIVDGSPDHPAVVSPDRAVRALGWQPLSLNRGLERYAQTLSA